jgi:hypothetical protein
MAADTGQAVDPAGDAKAGVTDQASGVPGSSPDRTSAAAEAPKSPDPTVEPSKTARERWKQRWVKFWVGGAAAVVIGVTITWSAGWLNSVVGPPAPPAPSAETPINAGHIPGRQDVSTMTPGQRFYAVPNFYYFQSCGRPCWLPLYESPNEQSALVTDGWPCEFYGPNPSSEPSCVEPPSSRTSAEMAKSTDRSSGDRILVVCQVRQMAKGVATQIVHNDVGQNSKIWDMIAVPKADISDNSTAINLPQISGLPGYYQAFASDMWLGNTGWHDIACSAA